MDKKIEPSIPLEPIQPSEAEPTEKELSTTKATEEDIPIASDAEGSASIVSKTMKEDGTAQGYKFEKDSIANQMAYVFGPPMGEKEAQAILDELEQNKTLKDPTQIRERQRFIEERIRTRSAGIDYNLEQAMLKNLKNLDFGNPTRGGRDIMYQDMRGLGLNVHEDNLRSYYFRGPPSALHTVWVNRPTQNLAKEDSALNRLAKTYADLLTPKEKKEFNESWTKHTEEAKKEVITDAPIMDKKAFDAKADESARKAEEALAAPQGFAPTQSDKEPSTEPEPISPIEPE